MNGKLTDHPLAELMREIASKGLSGALRLERERAKTVAYFEKGQIVFAASNLRTQRLREYLKKKGIISEKEYASLQNPGADLSLASSLCASGKLTEKDLDTLLATLVADVLRVPLLWTDGTWEFDQKARLDNPVRVTIDLASLLRETAHRLPLKLVALRFRNPNETISRSTDGSTTNSLLPAESFLLSRLDEPAKLEDLVAVSGLKEQDTYRVIYGLALGGLVQREYWQNAFRTEAAKPGPKPTRAVGSGSLPKPPPAEPQATDPWARSRDEESEDNLGEFLERLRAAGDYYEIINVPQTAAANQIKEAYYTLARRYHPDRFHLKSGTRLHVQISSAFARITQAYETLMDANARSTYDAGLARSRQLSETGAKSGKGASGELKDLNLEVKITTGDLGQAENVFREGFELLQKGQVHGALTRLVAASRSDPKNAKYHAYYGRALAADHQTRRLAESEIQTAVKLEPSNSLYRTMLAELYFDLKFHRRAQKELDLALELDPKNASALNLRDKLQKLG